MRLVFKLLSQDWKNLISSFVYTSLCLSLSPTLTASHQHQAPTHLCARLSLPHHCSPPTSDFWRFGLLSLSALFHHIILIKAEINRTQYITIPIIFHFLQKHSLFSSSDNRKTPLWFSHDLLKPILFQLLSLSYFLLLLYLTFMVWKFSSCFFSSLSWNATWSEKSALDANNFKIIRATWESV